MRFGRVHAGWGLAAAAVFALLLSGCVERTITVTSEPSGALVTLNDVQVGRTPLTTDFLFYGVYDVRVTKDGYAPLRTQAEAEAPWWDYPGPDLFAEAVPGLKSEVAWHFELEPRLPRGPGGSDGLLERAAAVRSGWGQDGAYTAPGAEPDSQPDAEVEPTESEAADAS
ncbi:MAG: PEGA domain-containing protein [Planctomycetota bacterium]